MVASTFTDAVSDMTARSYQVRIMEMGLSQNVIIYLPTGSGKTYIAIMVIKEMANEITRPLSDGGKRTVFLVNTVALARQQYETIRSLVNLKVVLYTGDLNVDNWQKEKWRNEFDEYNVIIATAQIVLDVIRHGFLSITDFNLMIFDECHHAINDHPMKQLMAHFQNHPASQLPRVIGLTGLLLKTSSPTNIEDDLNMMEATFRATIVTVSNTAELQNVLMHSAKPFEKTINYTNSRSTNRITQKVKDLVEQCTQKILRWDIDLSSLKATKNLNGVGLANPIKKSKNSLGEFLHKIEDMGLYGASIAALSVMVDFELTKRSAETIAIQNMSRLCISYIERIRHELMCYMKANGDYDEDDEYELYHMIYDNATQKIQAFLGYLEKNFVGKDPKDIRCLVFVERRQTAKCLFYLLKHFVENKQTIPIIPEFMVGQSRGMPESIETWLDTKRQKGILRKFKRGECNLVIASSVLEEGIDVQTCNCVIMYDKIKTFASYIQTKGRARMKDSVYAIMVESNDMPKLIPKISKWKETEKKLQDYLVFKTIERHLPLQEEIDEQFINDIEPYRTPLGAVLEACSAIQLLNRYCMTLPQDSFTSSTVQWYKEATDNKKIVVKVRLPLQSTVKEQISSDKVDSVKVAKRSAAMKACIRLYENKELNEHLLPVSKTNCFQLVDDIYFNHWTNFSADDPRLAGTGKSRRHHEISYPEQLTSAMPQIGSISYMYTIRLTAQFEENSANKLIADLLKTNSNFALLTCKPLPKLSKIPLFISDGQVTAEISNCPEIVTLSSNEEILILRRFQVMLFRDLLQTWNDFFACDFRNRENSFLIVPTDNGKEINWTLVRGFQSLQQPRELSEVQRQKLTFSISDYENSVVCPWYSINQSTRYIVSRVLTDLTPFSPFPNGSFSSYADYVKEKYGQNVVVKDQFMLLVHPLTSRRNLIHPGDGEGGRRNKTKRFEDIKLIPEFCTNFKFPRDLWLKAVFLPTILHRIHYLLLAEKLRVDIMTYLLLPTTDLITDTLPVTPRNVKGEEDIVEISGSACDEDLHKKALHVEKSSGLDVVCQWDEFKEPVDIDRKLDRIYEIELDYYVQFMQNLSVNETCSDKSLSPKRQPGVAAVLDGCLDRSNQIKLLSQHSALSQTDLLVAITRKSANDVFDMERLELLGDSFLKFSVSLYIFDRHSTWNEGCLTALKGRLVSNRNLFYHAARLKLPGLVNVDQFDPRSGWQPPTISVPLQIQQALASHTVSPYILFKLKLNEEEVHSGQVKDETLNEFISRFPSEEQCAESSLTTFLRKRAIDDKCCADAVEAILGVCVKNLGIECGFKMLTFFGICPQSDKDISKLINNLTYKPRLNACISDSAIDACLQNYEMVESNLGYKFKDRAYLLQAMTHPSYTLNRWTGCYQNLEFLGDAVLDFLVSSYIFERCSHMDPGELTDLRSALVNNVFLACLTVRYKFHLALLSHSASLLKAIEHFVHFQESNKNEITDQVRILVQEDECSIADYIEVPKALGDIFESLVGAVFLDSGNDLEQTWRVIYHLMSKEIGQFAQNVPKQVVRQLMEYKGANAQFSDPVVEDDIVMVICKFTCRGKFFEVNGFGKNSEVAKISAAKLALQTLRK